MSHMENTGINSSAMTVTTTTTGDPTTGIVTTVVDNTFNAMPQFHFVPEASAPVAPPAVEKRTKKKPLLHILDRIFGRPLAITPQKAETIITALGPRLTGLEPLVFWDDDEDDIEDDPEEKPDFFQSLGITCIPIRGTLVQRASGMSAMSGMAGYESMKAKIQDAINDPECKGILLDVDSPGGEVSGMFELADYIFESRSAKPIYAVCNDQMCSAAYALGSSATRVYVTRTSMTGSIGCYVLHVDQSGYDAERGLKFTYIQAGARKTEGNPHEPLGKDAKAELQGEVDRIRDMFVALVARNRGASAESILATEAGVFFGEAAIPLLADKLGTCEDAARDMAATFQTDSETTPDMKAPVSTGVAAGSVGTMVFVNGRLVERMTDLEIITSAFGRVEPHQTAAIDLMRDMVAGNYMRVTKASIAENSTGELSSDNSVACFGKPGVLFAVRRSAAQVSAPAEDSRKITMLVVPYDNSLSSNLGGFRERYEPGCFRNGLDNDPRATYGHDETMILGRKSSGTARFWEDAAGVHVEVDAPETQWADDLLVSMRRKDVRNSSAAFWITEQDWETRGGERVRIVRAAILREAAVLCFPAYPNATAETEMETTVNSLKLAQARLKVLRLR